MRGWLLPWLILLIVTSAAKAQFPPDKVARRSLGDINQDGKMEMAIETTSFGASSSHTQVKILAGKKVILILPWFSGNTADGYKVISGQIVAWTGIWNKGNQWSSHLYDFFWYQWDLTLGQFQLMRQGQTKKAYSYKEARRLMPLLASKTDESSFKMVVGPSSVEKPRLIKARQAADKFLAAVKSGDLVKASQLVDLRPKGTPYSSLEHEYREHQKIVGGLPPAVKWLVHPSEYDASYTVFRLERPAGYNWTLVVNDRYQISKFWCLKPGENDWE